MKKLLSIFIAYVCLSFSYAQNTNIGGQINHYSKVTAVNYCDNTMTVDSPSLFQPGMKVLIIQMQGAIIDVSNSPSYGNITNYNVAGNYEIEQVQSVTGNTILFQYEIERKYNAANSLQIIPLPTYQTATVTSNLVCKPWDGNTGGVLLLKADSLILNDTISVGGRGFRGFYANDSSIAGCLGTNPSDYGSNDLTRGAPKGEGIVQSFTCAHGKNANGGGGGNDHNSGGAGGGNGGSGGPGGRRGTASNFCQGNNPGVGGAALLYSNLENRTFMGGAGGCGDGNNSEGTGGANGGGICIIMANVLVGNGKPILANGLAPSRDAGADGAGGGGAGGTVMLSVNQYVGALTVNTTGGNGGKINNGLNPGQCWGPGGGAGGGVLWVSQNSFPTNINYIDTGGMTGYDTWNNPGTCLIGTTNGATGGNRGDSVMGLTIPYSARTFIKLTATASNDTALCSHQPLNLFSNGVSSDTVYYHWSTGQSVPNISLTTSQTTTYTVSVSDANTCTIVKNILVTVDTLNPSLTPDTTLCVAGNLTLQATNQTPTPATYQWSTGSNASSISFFASSSQTYTVTVTSPRLCTVTAAINVVVGGLNVSYSADTALCAGRSAILRTYAPSGSNYTYAWSTGSNTPTLSVSPPNGGSYTVTVSNAGGCRSIHTFNVVTDSIVPVFSRDTTICTPANITLRADNSTNTPAIYQWSTGGVNASITISANSTQTYTVTVSSSHGCSVTGAINVNVGALNVSYSNDTTICNGQSAPLTVYPPSGSNYTYSWSGGGNGPSIQVSPNTTTTYTVQISNVSGCTATHNYNVQVESVLPNFSTDTTICSPGTVLLHANNTTTTAVTYSWSTGASTATISPTVNTPATFTVTVSSNSNCSATATIRVNVGNLVVTFSRDTVICPGNNVILSTNAAAGGSYTYAWNTGESTSSITVSPTSNRNYIVTVTDANGCKAIHSYLVQLDYLGMLTSNDTIICPGGTATITADVPNVINVSYQWSNGATTAQTSVSPTSTQTYVVTTSSTNGCKGKDSVKVTIDQVSVTVSNDTVICPNSPAVISASGSGTGTLSYLWSNGATTSTITDSIAIDKTYSVTATDALGCTATGRTISVTTNDNATQLSPQLTVVPDSASYPGQPLQLTVSGGSFVQYRWYPTDSLSDSTSASPVATPLRATLYCVTVIDINHCAAIVCKNLAVGIPAADIRLPNAFTPNGDSKNDLYRIATSYGTAIASVKIYNRWGQLIYSAINNDGWDGTYQGTSQPSEAYTCVVAYYQEIYPEKLFHRSGNFILQR